MPRLAIVFLFLSAGLVSATEPPSSPASTPEERNFFEQKVRPLLIEQCHKCHSGQAKKHKGGLLLDSRAGVLKGGDSGPAVVPGQLDKSLLIQAVRYQAEHLQMPPTKKLAPEQVAILETWVRHGAVFPDAVAAVAVKTGGIDLAQGRKFWSFQPPKTVNPPPVRDAKWPRQRIDTFILAELDKHQLGAVRRQPRGEPSFGG